MKTMTQDQLATWNAFHPPGSPCFVRMDDGQEIETRTRSQAWTLASGHPVVLLEGRTGAFRLDRVHCYATHHA